MQGAILEELLDSDDDSSIVISYTYMADKRDGQDVGRHNILIDTGSNCSVFNNIDLLTDVRKSKQRLRAMTNGGSQESEYQGMLPGFFEVWYNPNSMLNILSFGEVASRFRITMDTAQENAILVHMDADSGAVLRFKEAGAGLYLLQTNNNDLVTHYSYLQLIRTANSNSQYYSKRELFRAEQARSFYEHVNVTGYANFIKLLEKNYFRDCPITAEDARRAMELFGKEPQDTQGRGTRQRPIAIKERLPISIPESIKERHNNISISVDYLYIQGAAMLHTILGKSYQFRTLEPVYKPKPNKDDIITGLTNIINTYHARGINITQINGDNEFACVGTALLPSRMNVMAADEHVGDVERSIRHIKDGTRTQINGLPYTHYLKSMIVGCVMYVLKHVNHLPSRGGLSQDLSPATLITGDPTPSYQELTKLKFGDYVHTAYGKTTNDQTTRTVGAIALYPSGNTSGGWFFMSVLSGKVLHRYSWTKMTITQDVLQRLTDMAINEGQGLVGDYFKYSYTKTGHDIQFELIGDEDDFEYEESLPTSIPNTEEMNLLAEHAHEESRNDDDDNIHREQDNNERDDNEEAIHPKEREEVEERRDETNIRSEEDDKIETEPEEEEKEEDASTIHDESISDP